MKRVHFWIVVAVCVGLASVFFYPTILHRKLPVPTDTLVGLYHPWRDLYADTNPRGVPYKNFLITDPVRQQIPWKKTVIDAWKQGTVPKLNPYSFAGVPLDANIQAAPFYPFNLLFFVTDFPSAWTLLITVQPVLMLFFAYLYLARRGLGTGASLLGALAWAFGGFSVAWLTWGTIVHTALWIPLMLLGLDLLAAEKKQRVHPIVLIVLAASMMLFGGHMQIALYGGIFAVCYALWQWNSPHYGKRYRALIIAGAVILLITLPQWQPFIGFFSQSARGTEVSAWKNPGWFMPWEHIIQFIAPDFFGNPATLNYWGEWNYGEFVGYIGMVPLLLALSALFLPGEPRFFSSILFAALFFMLPHPLSKFPFQLQIPVFSVLQPTRLMALVSLCLAVLTAYGARHFMMGKSRRVLISAIFIGGSIGLLWIGVYGKVFETILHITPENLAVSKRNIVLPTVLYIAGIALLFLYHTIRAKGIRTVLGLAVFTVCVVDLFRFGWKFNPFTPGEYFFPTTKTIEFLTRQQKPFRVMSLDDRILPPNAGAYYGIESIEGYDPMAPLRYDRFLSASERGKYDPTAVSGFHRIYTAHTIDSVLLPYFNVRYVLSLTEVTKPFLREVFREGDTRVYEYRNALPRVYLAEEVTEAKTDDIIPLLFEESTLRRAVYDGSERILSAPLSGDESVTIENYRNESMTVKTTTANRRILTILNRYDTRWSATIDGGKKLRIYPVNYLFMGVTVPEGTHRITLSYR